MSSGILLRIIILSLIMECILYLHYKMKLFLMPCIFSQPQPHPNLPVKGVKIWYAHRKSAVTACYCLHVHCAVQQHATAGAGLEHATTHTCPDPASVISQWDNSTQQHTTAHSFSTSQQRLEMTVTPGVIVSPVSSGR